MDLDSHLQMPESLSVLEGEDSNAALLDVEKAINDNDQRTQTFTAQTDLHRQGMPKQLSK